MTQTMRKGPTIEAPAQARELQGRKALWQVAERLDSALASQVPDVSHMVAHLLYQRGYTSAEAITAFLREASPMHDPSRLPDVKPAVERIRRGAKSGERIAIYGDFDCDGLTASAIFLDTLRLLGADPIVVIPTRNEGHGMKEERLRALAQEGVSLVVSADCGIGDVGAVRAARELGMDVIVTDHHQPPVDGSLPEALVVSPTRHDSRYPWRYLSGAGVAYKVATALLDSPERSDKLLDLAAFGTIVDVVPLRDENRTLVIRGLDRLRNTTRCGLRALFSVAGIDSRLLDHASVGFYLGPRINAANRMADPRTAFDLITAVDPAEANRLAQELDGHNTTRQEQVARGLAEAIDVIGLPAEVRAEIKTGNRAPIICVFGEWAPGISGLLASDLTEKYCVPVLAAARRPDGVVAASGRSVKDVNILEILQRAHDRLPDLFLGFGGHAGACGFTVQPEGMDLAFSALGQASLGIVPIDDLVMRIQVDAQIRLAQVDMRSLALVETLGPYGNGFEEPVFLARGVYLSGRRRVGSGGKHVKITARSGTFRVAAIIFSCDPELADFPEDAPVDLAFSIGRDEYNGLSQPQIRVRDWRPFGPE